jgi:hypothetical protein
VDWSLVCLPFFCGKRWIIRHLRPIVISPGKGLALSRSGASFRERRRRFTSRWVLHLRLSSETGCVHLALPDPE